MKYLAYIALSGAIFSMSAAGASPQGKVYHGTYFYNFESSSFTPDGSTEQWCLSGDMSVAELPAKGPSGPWGTAHVVVRGTLSPPGHYCNLGASKYVLNVYEVLDVKEKQAESH